MRNSRSPNLAERLRHFEKVYGPLGLRQRLPNPILADLASEADWRKAQKILQKNIVSLPESFRARQRNTIHNLTAGQNVYANAKELYSSAKKSSEKHSVIELAKTVCFFHEGLAARRDALHFLSTIFNASKPEDARGLQFAIETSMFQDPHPAIRAQAVSYVEKMKNLEAVKALSFAYAKEKDDNVRCDIILALGKTNSKFAERALRQALTDEFPPTAKAAERALRQIK